MTFDSDVTFPLLKDVKNSKADAVCEARPTNVSSNLLVNRDKEPFNNATSARRWCWRSTSRPSTTFCSRAMPLTALRCCRRPAGFWGMPKEMLPELLGPRARPGEKPRRGARS
jgi:peptide/nickel transport system substrate-binding protein